MLEVAERLVTSYPTEPRWGMQFESFLWESPLNPKNPWESDQRLAPQILLKCLYLLLMLNLVRLSPIRLGATAEWFRCCLRFNDRCTK